MKKDIPFTRVSDVKVAIAKTIDEKGESDWYAYVINNKPVDIDNLLVNSSAVEHADGSGRKTSQLRHFIEHLKQGTYAKVERVDPAVFGFYNRYWVSFYIGREVFDKKFVLPPFHEWETVYIEELDMDGVWVE
jgi:hypothetical protein